MAVIPNLLGLAQLGVNARIRDFPHGTEIAWGQARWVTR
jgi:hypothetical protein